MAYIPRDVTELELALRDNYYVRVVEIRHIPSAITM